MSMKRLLKLQGYVPSINQTAQMSQRQVRRFIKKPIPKIVMHKEIIEEQAQRDFEASLKQDGRLSAQEVEHLRENNPEKLVQIQQQMDKKHMPVPGLENPFKKPPAKCIICEQNVELNYKNVRLLSQFVSSHTGQIFGRDKTGLCIYMQRRVSRLIYRARRFGFMPVQNKTPEYLTDPRLFDPFRGPFGKKR